MLEVELVVIIFNNKIQYVRREDLESDNMELMWLEIIRKNIGSHCVGIII